MLRRLSIICRQFGGHPGVMRTYHDVRKSFASNVNHPLEVLELIPREPKALSPIDILAIFYDLQRTQSRNPCEWSAIQNHPKFSILNESTKEYLSASQTSSSSTNLVAILRTVQNLGLPVDHDLTQSILRVILHQVSFLTLDDIFTLDRLVSRASCNKRKPDVLHEKLLLILPMVYQINYLDDVDYEDVNELCASLDFIANNFERMSRRAVSGVVTSLRMSNIKQTHAIRIIASLSKLKYINAHIEPLLKKCIHMVADAPLAPDEIEILLKSLAHSEIGADRFDRKFFEKCVQRLIQSDCDIMQACSIRKRFAEQKFSSVEFLEFICKKLGNQLEQLPIYETLGLIMDMSSAKYKPSNWDDVILPMIEKLQLWKFVEQFKNIDWPRIAISLDQLGHHDPLLIEQIMRSDLEKSFQQNYGSSFRKLAQLCREDSFSSLAKMLTESIGENKVLSVVSTEHNSSIKCALKINRQTGQFTAFADHELRNKNLSLNEIRCDANQLLIGIISSGLPRVLRQKMMSLDLVMVPIDVRKWTEMPEYMKMTEVFNKITKHIQIYQDKGKTVHRHGHRNE